MAYYHIIFNVIVLFLQLQKHNTFLQPPILFNTILTLEDPE